MRFFSFLRYPKTFSKKPSNNPKPPPPPTRTLRSTATPTAPTFVNHHPNPSRRFRPNPQEMRRVFDKYDANRDGRVSLAEYAALVRATGLPRDADDVAVRQMFEAADRDGDGFIDFEEFLGVNSAGGGVQISDIVEAFRVFDLDGDGRIGAEEVAAVLGRIGGFEGCGVEACRRMVKGVDRDGDGLVDLDEFTNMMTSSMKLVYN